MVWREVGRRGLKRDKEGRDGWLEGRGRLYRAHQAGCTVRSAGWTILQLFIFTPFIGRILRGKNGEIALCAPCFPRFPLSLCAPFFPLFSLRDDGKVRSSRCIYNTDHRFVKSFSNLWQQILLLWSLVKCKLQAVSMSNFRWSSILCYPLILFISKCLLFKRVFD